MKWEDFYKNRLNGKYFNHIKRNYHPFIKELQDNIKESDTVLEVGCGIGSITKALNELTKASLKISDKNKLMLELSKLNTGLEGISYDILEKVNVEADLIHSHGVLEHFNPKEIKKIIRNQLKTGAVLIHYVPSSKYKYKSFGDENLLSIEEWGNICSPKEIKPFNNGYDLTLIWR